MCLTAKPTVEWTASTAQVEPAGMGGEAMAVMWEFPRSGPWSVCVERKIAHETDRGPVILPNVPALPVITSAPAERADAARNRRRVLEAAAELFQRNPECVTMEAVAAAAGVGKGTVFR